MTPEEADITWESAWDTLTVLIPSAPEMFEIGPVNWHPTRLAAMRASLGYGFIEGAARRMDLPVEWIKVPEWESYAWGHIDYDEAALLSFIYRDYPMPQTGNVVFIPESPTSPRLKWQPYRMKVSELIEFLNAFPECTFDASRDICFIFEEARLVTLFMHEGYFAHINCRQKQVGF